LVGAGVEAGIGAAVEAGIGAAVGAGLAAEVGLRLGLRACVSACFGLVSCARFAAGSGVGVRAGSVGCVFAAAVGGGVVSVRPAPGATPGESEAAVKPPAASSVANAAAETIVLGGKPNVLPEQGEFTTVAVMGARARRLRDELRSVTSIARA
jgi:hypothetical protein